jgi:hypothetical protein
MNDKIKGGLSIFFMAATFYMMITTKYTNALGDYVLEFIGLKSWTGYYSGLHLTIIYFGILFIICLFVVGKYAVNRMNIRRRNVFFVFLALMIVFYSITGVTVQHIKSNSQGLLSIGYSSSESSIDYRSENNKFIEFIAEFELTNYSNEKRTFYFSITNPYDREEGIEEIRFYNNDGKRAMFELKGNQTKLFSLGLDNYDVIGGREFQNGSGSGIVQEILLTDDKGIKVRLDSKNFFGVEINR